MPRCLIGLGSNVGDRAAMLDFAARRLRETPDIRVIAHSRWIETKPAGGPAGQSPFLNGAALIETTLGPEALLNVLHQVENEAGRRRLERWGPRTLDLDLLLYGDAVIDTPRLTVPHPRMAFRRFVLEPSAEIAGEMVHPLIGWSVDQLWRHARTTPRQVVLAGPAAGENARLASAVSDALCTALPEGSSPTPRGHSPVECPPRPSWVIRAAPPGGVSAARLTVIVEPLAPTEADKVTLHELPKQIVGPWIRVSTRSWQSAVEEIVAAIEAMSE